MFGSSLDQTVLPSVQGGLSRAQAIPILGPVLVSPIKAVVSIVQVAVGLFSAMCVGIMAVLSSSRGLEGKTIQALAFAGAGYLSFLYSILNMDTLGIVGFLTEFVFKINPGFI